MEKASRQEWLDMLRRRSGAAVIVALAIGLYWWLLVSHLESKRQDLQEQTRLRSGQLAATLAAQVETQFSSLDVLVTHLANSYVQGNQATFDATVRSVQNSYPAGVISQIAVADASGQLVYSTLNSPRFQRSGTDISDREHFYVHQHTAAAALFISKPLIGRISQRWSIQISRPIHVNGAMAGVVVLSVTPSYLSKFFRNILSNQRDVILLLRSDGSYMARSRDEEQVLGRQVPTDREFVTHPKLQRGFYALKAPVDGVMRSYAWNRVGNYPLIISMGLDQLALTAPLEEEIQSSLLRNVMGTIALIMTLLVVQWLAWQRQRATQLADQNELLLQQLVAEVPGALYQLEFRPHQKTRLTFCSPSMPLLHNVDVARESIDITSLLGHIHPEDAPSVVQAVRNSIKHKMPLQVRYRIPAADGTMRWLSSTAKPSPLMDGATLLHGYVSDVSELHTVQEALRTSEERLRQTLDAVDDGMWEWNLETDTIRWDARCCEMLGQAAESMHLTSTDLQQWMHPSDRDKFNYRLKIHLEHGEHYRNEFRLRHANGHWVWIESRGNAIRGDTDGRPLRMLGTHTDISTRVIQAHLRRALLDESAAAIILATPTRYIAHANMRAHSMFAKEGTSLVGQSLRAIHQSAESFEIFSQCYPALRDEGQVRQEYELRFADGSIHWCDIQGTLQDPEDPDGDVIWTVFDIDDRHRAETALRVAQKRLMAIIDRYPGCVLVQECTGGPIVAINQAFGELLQLPRLALEFPPALLDTLNRLLPPEMHERIANAHIDGRGDEMLSCELNLSSGRVFEMHRIPLQSASQSVGLLWIARDMTAAKRREMVLAQQAFTDTLTELPNRRAFMEQMQSALHTIHSGQQTSAMVLMLDIDFFKKVNDTWGHATGDEVLRHLSALLRSLLNRAGDLPSRLGGEEFAALLPQTSPEGAQQLAERLRETVAATPARTTSGDISFTVSIGLAPMNLQTHHVDDALAQADAALYYAKRHGRNRVVLWSNEIAQATTLAISG